ncbi:MAG: protein-L-isoaspartate O-methyltransferase, partial [Pantoea piersonii]
PAAPPEIPTALIAQLDEGGIMVLPVGDDQQVLKRLRRQGGDIVEECIEPVRFVPLVQGDLA